MMESIVRPFMWTCLLAFCLLQIYVLVMKRKDVSWSELLGARLKVLYRPDKYLRPAAGLVIKLFLVALAVGVTLIWTALWSTNQH